MEPTRELPTVTPRCTALPNESSADRAEALAEGICLIVVGAFVVGVLAYAVAIAFGWHQ